MAVAIAACCCLRDRFRTRIVLQAEILALHKNEEMILIADGTLEVTINGTPTRADRGSVVFVRSNDEHGIRNPEDTHAKYFIFGLGVRG